LAKLSICNNNNNNNNDNNINDDNDDDDDGDDKVKFVCENVRKTKQLGSRFLKICYSVAME